MTRPRVRQLTGQLLQRAILILQGFVALIVTGSDGTLAMPARVQAEIARREAAAERTIGWVQLSVVAFFALLYTLAPRAEGGLRESFVPMTLAFYFAFTVFRIMLSYRKTLPGWFLVLSMFVDVALLCGLIFSFHIQYEQPAAFYLKAPTIMYFFIFISLRTLRFDPRYVLVSGMISAGGWIMMVAYALVSDPEQMTITRNYVEYVTSNAILIGAEVDKAIALFGVTLILSFALYRARQVLISSIESHAAATDLSHFFAPEVAQMITQADDMPATGTLEIRMAAIVFVDVRDFTANVRGLPPAAVMAILACYQDVAIRTIEQHNGRVDKFMGDGILATFGAVQPSDTYAADALRATSAVLGALDGMRDAFAGLGWPVSFQTGASAASGDVMIGVVGAQGRLEFTVIGNPVNLAAKMEKANKTLGTRILTDNATFAQAQAQGYVAAAPRLLCAAAVAGVADPVDLVALA